MRYFRFHQDLFSLKKKMKPFYFFLSKILISLHFVTHTYKIIKNNPFLFLLFIYLLAKTSNLPFHQYDRYSSR